MGAIGRRAYGPFVRFLGGFFMVKVVLIGAGSASFGRGAIADLLASEELEQLGLEMVLVDVDEGALERML
ncbi:MAG: hypothetical protein DRP95_05800, partial [Candidatus Latescibacterota bacterium]